MENHSLLNEKEQQIKEKRKAEAVRKNLMTPNGKFGIIVKTLGQPIINQFEGIDDLIGYSSNDIYYDYDNNELPIMEILDETGSPIEEPNSFEWTRKNNNRKMTSIKNICYFFDGLSRGFNLQIRYLTNESEIIVEYNNDIVYQEFEGDLISYKPLEDWENKIDLLFEKCKKINEKDRKEQREKKIKIVEKEKENWLSKLKNLWGI